MESGSESGDQVLLVEGGGEVVSSSDGGEVEKGFRKIPFLVFLIGVWTRLRNGFEGVLKWDWFNWWPFWRQEKKLDHLIADANANPKDAAKQAALLAELNKHRYCFLFLF